MRFELSPHVKRVKVYALSKVVGFLRALRFPPTGKVDRVGWFKQYLILKKAIFPKAVGLSREILPKQGGLGDTGPL